jgi:hypothetical protein
MEKAPEARHAVPQPRLLDWPDSGGVAHITWHTASGQVYQQEIAGRREAEELLAKIGSNDELTLVSAQMRRVGIGPDS